jgi:hypothetical protein
VLNPPTQQVTFQYHIQEVNQTQQKQDQKDHTNNRYVVITITASLTEQEF